MKENLDILLVTAKKHNKQVLLTPEGFSFITPVALESDKPCVMPITKKKRAYWGKP